MSSASASASAGQVITIPGFQLDLAQALVRDAGGQEVRLRPQSFDVLHLLALNADRVVTKEELMQSVWTGTVVTDDSLVQCIKEIRLALNDREHRLVRTAPKRGYSLVTAGAPRPQQPAVPLPEPENTDRRRFGHAGVSTLALGGLACAAGLGGWWWLRGTAVQPVAKAAQPSIIVLPIRNISGGERWDRLARGLTEDITTDLARHRWLFIIASSAAFQRAADGQEARSVARDLQVRFALDGSLQTEGESVRVNARLIEAESGATIWSQHWNRLTGQLFDIQDAIVEAISSALGSAWTGVIAASDRATARRRPTSNLQAYELFLIGLEHKHRFTPQDLVSGRDLLRRAVELDPGFSKAWAALAIVHVNLMHFAADDTARQAELTARRHAIEHARAADPDDPDGLIQWSWLRSLDGDPEGAVTALRRAVTMAPNNADVLAVAGLEGGTHCEPADEALDWVRHAHRLNPNPPAWYFMCLGIAALYSKQYALATDAFSRAPDFPLVWRHRAVAQALNGDLAAARQTTRRLLDLAPGLSARQITADHGEWGNPKAVALFLEGARLAGIPA